MVSQYALKEAEITDKYFRHIVINAYESLCINNEPILFEEIVECVYWEVYEEVRCQKVDEAIQRGDHHLYNICVEEYVRCVYSGVIDIDVYEPNITYSILCSNTLQVLEQCQYFYIGYNNEIRNCPLQEVW